jgi:hypothetical protein
MPRHRSEKLRDSLAEVANNCALRYKDAAAPVLSPGKNACRDKKQNLGHNAIFNNCEEHPQGFITQGQSQQDYYYPQSRRI